jgi:ribosomal protein S12 methylthiotransferase accessory factor
MIERPQFKAHIRVEVVKGEGVIVLSETGHAALDGQLFELVAPLIDGRRTADDIAEELQPQASCAEVYYALKILEGKGYLICSRPTGSAAPEAVFWSLQGIDPDSVCRRLAETTISITVFGDVPVKSFLTTLTSANVRIAEVGNLGVVLTDDYLRQGLSGYNQQAFRRQQPWIIVKPTGARMLIGPIFDPPRTACWNCLAHRLRINRTVEMFVQRKQNQDDPPAMPQASISATEQIAYGIATTKILKWIAEGRTSQADIEIVSVDVLKWQAEHHPLTRQPHCAVCGDRAATLEGPPQPFILESRQKTFAADGGHRVVGPEETLRKYERHVSRITGAVSILERHVMAIDGLLHVYLAGENYGAQHHRLKDLRQDLRSFSAGKGIGDLQAKASALCEALERYSGVFQGTETRRRAKFGELDGLGIHPNACMHFSDRQYRERDVINARGSRYCYVPLPFDEEQEIEWSPVWSLTRQIYRYLPTEYCFYGYTPPQKRPFCVACSNGNAAGNTREEAILQGFLELVERDSVALWWYNRVRRPGVDLDAFDEPYFGKLKAFLEERHRELWVLDLTSDLGIPVFGAVSRLTNGAQERIVIGFGAHLEPRIALMRAVTEVNQMLVWLLPAEQQEKEIPDNLEDPELRRWLENATIATDPYLVPSESGSLRTAQAYAKQWTDDLRDDLLLCKGIVERQGLEMLVLDQTRPDIGLPVVKVIVPGLRHFWARFAPGRLYDAPVKLGWLPQPLLEAQLNPLAMFV